MRIYSPEGEVGTPPISLAPAPPVLAGQRVAVLENGKPNAKLLMTRVAERLSERAGVEVAFVTDKGSGNAATPADQEVIEKLAAEADLVLTGSAD